MSMSKIKIADFAEVITGGTPSTSNPEYWENGDVPWLQSGACQNDVITGCDTFITQKGLENSAAKMMKPDSVLIALTGATTGKVGYLTFEACANQSVTGIQPNERFVSKYLFYYLRGIRKKILDDSYGGAQKHISQGYVKNIEVPLGSIEEQKTITKLLESVDTTIALRQQELQLLDDLIKARFVEMFGDPVNNEKNWTTKPLLSMGSCKNGMNFHYDDSGVEINCLGVGDFKDYSIIADTAALPTVSLNEMPSPDYLLRDDDIVFVRSNGNKKMVGRSVAVYPGAIPTTFSGFCIRYRREDDSVITPYLLRVLKAESMRQKMYGRGANIQNLNQQTLSSLDIPVPPKAMQEQFATFVAQVDKSKVVVQKALDEAQILFDSLMQQYFG